MGALLGLLPCAAVGGCATTVACCCGTAACSLCCKACPSCKNSTATRIAYAIFLMFGIGIAIAMLGPLGTALKGIPKLCDYIENCDNFVGYFGVYRVCFALVAFFLLLAIITIRVKSSKDPRAGIHNGFWFFKVLIFLGLIFAGIYGIKPGSFDQYWMYCGLIGGSLFIVIQLILIVDFAHNINETWIENYEEYESKGWYCLLLSTTLFCYIVSIAAVVLLFVFYSAKGDCSLNKAFISVNLVLCAVVSVISILPAIQDALPRSGLLQSSIITLYTVYLTWSALSSSPDMNPNCNPSLGHIFDELKGVTFPTATPILSTASLPIDSSTLLTTVSTDTPVSPTLTGESIISMIIWFICVLYASIRTSNSTDKITGSSGKEHTLLVSDSKSTINEDSEAATKNVWDNESEVTSYNYSLMHIVFMLATFYVMMTLTNWLEPSGADLTTMQRNLGAMWVKIVTSWVCIIIYGWTMIAPLVLTGRDFD